MMGHYEIEVASERTIQFDFPAGAEHIEREMQRRSWYEMSLLEDIKQNTVPGQWAVDVGAYMGTHSVWMAAICGLNVIAVEPVHFEDLLHNIYINGLHRNIDARRAALGAEQSWGRAELSSKNTGETKIVRDDVGTIRIDTLDASIWVMPTVIKIDVEDSELDVLRGGEKLIREYHPLLYIESRELADVSDLLRDWGYKNVKRFRRLMSPTYRFSV